MTCVGMLVRTPPFSLSQPMDQNFRVTTGPFFWDDHEFYGILGVEHERQSSPCNLGIGRTSDANSHASLCD